MLCYISEWFLFLSPARSLREFFSDTYSGNLVELLEIYLTILWATPITEPLLEFLTLELPALSIHCILQFLQFRFPYPGTCFHCYFYSWVSDSISYLSLSSPVCLSNLGVSGLSCAFTSFTDARNVIDFSICSAFYLFLRQSGDVQTSYVENWKRAVQYWVLKVFKVLYQMSDRQNALCVSDLCFPSFNSIFQRAELLILMKSNL